MPRIAPTTYFPFLTCEWKTEGGDQGHTHASLQGARDGACIVNYNQAFLEAAGLVPSIIDTCHFSVTCDILSAMLWVHWRESKEGYVEHYARMISHENIRDADEDKDNPGMRKFRARLRNILEWAQGTRLEMFRSAIAKMPADAQHKAKRQKTSAS